MALVIKGDMPKGCCWSGEHPGFCQLRPICDAFANKTSLRSTLNKRLETCPIIGEIPDERGRLIDADTLADHFFKYLTICFPLMNIEKAKEMVDNVKEALKIAPTVLEASN